ncbi:hypothetical protein BDZ89DRAFT_1063228 [Hymenopellis radicata]|nr:hypothetical protein BDZ89DRAFT_1063228 [Hymenopellis radicata]
MGVYVHADCEGPGRRDGFYRITRSGVSYRLYRLSAKVRHLYRIFPRLHPRPRPRLILKTQESGYIEEDDGTQTTRDAYTEHLATSRLDESMELNTLSVANDQEDQTVTDDCGNKDHVPLPRFALETESLQLTVMPTAPISNVEPADPPSSPVTSMSKNAPLVGVAQVLALDTVSTSVHCASSSVCGVEQVTPSTISVGTGTSAVPCTLGKSVFVAADAPVEGSSSDSEEGGRRTPKRSSLWNIFPSFQS